MQRGSLESQDRVEFTYKGKVHGFRVTASHLAEDHGNNGGFLSTLALDGQLGTRYDVATRAYGYGTASGDWPDYRDGDYGAAWRLCLNMYNIIQALEYGSTTTTVNSTAPPPAYIDDPKFDTGDEVSLRGNDHIKGRVLGVTNDKVSVAWADGGILHYAANYLNNLTRTRDLLTKKQMYNEYLQRQDLPIQGVQGTSRDGVSGGTCSTATGSRHSPNQASFEDCEPRIRQGKVRGSVFKF